MRLQGKVVAITGGALGIGRATAELFAAEGATVALGDTQVPGAETVAKEIVGRGDRMRSPAWKCSTCMTVFEAAAPVPVPAPCIKCGGIVFEAVRRIPQ